MPTKAIDFAGWPIDHLSIPVTRKRWLGEELRGRHQSQRVAQRYAFGPFVADAVKRQLWRDGSLVPITSKTFDLLIVLLEHRDNTVSKDELLNRVWPETSVNENNLARQVLLCAGRSANVRTSTISS